MHTTNKFYITHIIIIIIIHQTHYEKSDWLKAFNQFTVACELDMINALSAADIAFIMSQLIEWNGYETRQTPLLYVFVDLKVHNVQKNSYHFDCIDQ